MLVDFTRDELKMLRMALYHDRLEHETEEHDMTAEKVLEKKVDGYIEEFIKLGLERW